VVVLMYHAFRLHPIPGDDITPADFAAQLALFRADGYHVITLSTFEAFVSGRGRVPPNALLLTFDNGYASMYRYAYPLLLRYHDPATLFPIARWLFHPGQAPPGIHPMSLKDLRTMLASGLMSLGTQGWDVHQGVPVGPDSSEAADIGRIYNAATGRRESVAAYEARVLGDLRHAQQALAPLVGGPLQAFAYPFGDYTPRLIALLHAAGFRYLFTAKIGWANIQGQSPAVLYRINVGSYGETAADAVSAIATVASDTAAHPGWRPPQQSVEVWHP
jgi:peptidoglycan/xylan/chitin deacetylase (PgdA/CDA1 family)